MKAGDRVKTINDDTGMVVDILYSKASGKPYRALVAHDSDGLAKHYFICNLTKIGDKNE